MISRARGPARFTAESPCVTSVMCTSRLPVGEPPGEPVVDRARAARGGGHVEGVVVEPADRAVVHDPARRRSRSRRSGSGRASGSRSGSGRGGRGTRRRRGRARSACRAWRRRSGPAASCTASASAARVAVVVGAAPVARPHHVGAELAVAARGSRSAWRARTGGRRARPSAPRARAGARWWCPPRPRLVPVSFAISRTAGAGTCGPGTGPSSWSCSAWRARSSRSPPRRSGGCPSRSRPRTGRRSTCPRGRS